MSNSRPSDYVNLAELGIIVAQSWQNNYSDYTIKFVTPSELLNLSVLFKTKAVENTQQDVYKKQNTTALRTVNKEIDTAIKMLRRYLKAEYVTEKNLSTHYAQYGLELDKGNSFSIVSDNDRRRQRMSILIAKLSEPNNPIAAKQFGLSHWIQLQAQHNTAWDDSKNMKTRKTTLSRETQKYAAEVKELLRKLQAQIKIDFPKTDHPKVLREFGFLNEVYK